MRYLLITILSVLILPGCKSKQGLKDKREELTKGTLDERSIYQVPEVGWTVKIPQDWPVISKKDMTKLSESGKDLLKNTTGTEVDVSSMNVLINLKKDPFNIFISTMEPFEGTESEYATQNRQVYDVLKQAFAAKNIPCEYKESTMQVDGLDFDVFAVSAFDAAKKKVIISQKYFSRLINQQVFSMIINYNNETDEKTLMNMVETSRFSRK